jgi:hypothetical protein
VLKNTLKNNVGGGKLLPDQPGSMGMMVVFLSVCGSFESHRARGAPVMVHALITYNYVEVVSSHFSFEIVHYPETGYY